MRRGRGGRAATVLVGCIVTFFFFRQVGKKNERDSRPKLEFEIGLSREWGKQKASPFVIEKGRLRFVAARASAPRKTEDDFVGDAQPEDADYCGEAS